MNETIIRGADAPEFGDDGVHVIGYGSPSRGSESVAAWKLSLEPGAASPVHRLTHHEVFIVLSGRGRFDVEDRRHDVGPGDAVCVPPQTAFALSNAGQETMTAICCMAAGGQARIGDGDPFPIPWAQ